MFQWFTVCPGMTSRTRRGMICFLLEQVGCKSLWLGIGCRLEERVAGLDWWDTESATDPDPLQSATDMACIKGLHGWAGHWQSLKVSFCDLQNFIWIEGPSRRLVGLCTNRYVWQVRYKLCNGAKFKGEASCCTITPHTSNRSCPKRVEVILKYSREEENS